MSGRIATGFLGDDADFIDSDYVFVLGDHTLVGRYPLNEGDLVAVEQEHDFVGVVPTLVRFTCRLRNPAFTPAGFAWRFSIALDGSEQFGRVMRLPDRNLYDMAFCLPSSGLHTVRFQLALVAAA